MPERPMTRHEFKACLQAIERTELWFCKKAGMGGNSTVGRWFAPGGPGMPPKLAARHAGGSAGPAPPRATQIRGAGRPTPPPLASSQQDNVSWRRRAKSPRAAPVPKATP